MIRHQTPTRPTPRLSSPGGATLATDSAAPPAAEPETRGPTLGTALDAFLADLEIGRSPASVRTYRAALVRFVEFMSTHRLSHGNAGSDDALALARAVPVADLTTEHPIEFLRWLARGSATPKTTIMTYTTAVSRFYAFLVREDISPDLQLARMQLRLSALRGKKPKSLPRVPADDVVEAIVAAARRASPGAEPADEKIRLRNVALVEALRGSGMRVSEAVGLRRGDLDRQQRAARVVGKGSNERVVFFTDDAWSAIERYLATRGDGAAGRALAGLPLFARHDRGAGRRLLPLSTKAVRDIVWELAKTAEVDDAGVTPHRLRAWFATHLVAKTGDLAAVQDLLGHESADTTRIYTKVAGTRLRDVHRRAFEAG